MPVAAIERNPAASLESAARPAALQDGQIFKERCEDSPGIVMFCQGDWWHPTAERVAMLERENYYVITAANGRTDIPFWLPHERCIGAMFGHHDTVEQARASYPDKVVERFEGVNGRFARNIMQDLPNSLHYAGEPYTACNERELKTVDVVSSFAPVALKRGSLLLEVLLRGGVSAYVFAHYFGNDAASFGEFSQLVQRLGYRIDFFHYPFDPYALIRIDNRIVIDCRPVGANSALVANYLARARLYVHTSTTEGFSNAIMEALNNDVPVLICEDILGPLQALRQEIPACIHAAPADATSLIAAMKSLLAAPPARGAIRSQFSALLNPYELNRRMVRGAQRWFASRGLPWKGHCLGILGGIQTRLDLSRVTAEESYRGDTPIYTNREAARQYVAFHANVALKLGRNDLAVPLVNELKLISQR